MIWLLCFDFIKNDSLFGHLEVVSVVRLGRFIGHIQKITNLIVLLLDFAWFTTMRDIFDFLFDFVLEESTVIFLGNDAQEVRIGLGADKIGSGTGMRILKVDVAELMFAVFKDRAVFRCADMKLLQVCVDAAK